MSRDFDENGSAVGKQRLEPMHSVRSRSVTAVVPFKFARAHDCVVRLTAGAAEFDQLIERSSFGTADALRARRSTSEEKVAEIVARVRGIGCVDGHISSAEPSRRWRSETEHMAKKSGGETTSKSVASKASAILSNPKSSAAAKSVAASALTQAANKGKKSK
jgi:hypothetical protein